MFENTTVTLPLNDFDALREGEREYRKLASALASCFDYTCKKNPEPKACKDCNGEVDCPDCEHYIPDYEEKLTLHVERLVRITKPYAMYGKEIEADLGEITVERVDA